jgi:SAM-dependent methyltransferase
MGEDYMKQNKYDDSAFFDKYSQMDRSKKGLEGAGEWETLKRLLPDFHGKRVLDLGCGYGWHCVYALEHGAASTVGVDISEKMLAVAKEKTVFGHAEYRHIPIEDIDFPESSFDVVISSLALHYVTSFEDVAKKVHSFLASDGVFIFSVEHPVFTAQGPQDWHYDSEGNILHFPVDNYFYEGKRKAVFLGEEVVKYHRTLTTYLNGLLRSGFNIAAVEEPMPSKHLLDTVPGMKDELRRPMMLIVSARK